MENNLLVYDPKNFCLLDFNGEILREDIIIKQRTHYGKYVQLSNKEIDSLPPSKIPELIYSKYGFQGVRLNESYPVFKGINDILDAKNDISSPYKGKIMSIFLRLSTKQGILKSPKRHCVKWMDLMDVPWLRLSSRSEVYRFKKVLTDHNIVRKGPERLVVNPYLGYNNTVLFNNTYSCFRDIINIPYLEQKYFNLGFDSVLKTKNQYK